MEKQITMSKECERVYKKITKEFDFFYEGFDHPMVMYIPIKFVFDTMDTIDYELFDMGYFPLSKYYDSPLYYMEDSTKDKKEYTEEKNVHGQNLFHILYTSKQQEEDFAILFIGEESSCDNVDWEIYKIIFIENEKDTVIFDGYFINDTEKEPMEESENNNTNDLENRVNTLEDKLDTIIKMLANK